MPGGTPPPFASPLGAYETLKGPAPPSGRKSSHFTLTAA